MSKRNRLPRHQGNRPGSATRDQGATGNRSHAAEPGRRRGSGGGGAGGPYWLYGSHALKAALANPRRRFERFLLSDVDLVEKKEILEMVENRLGDPGPPIRVEPLERAEIARLLPEGAVHQGMAGLVQPLPPAHVEEICDQAAALDRAIVVILDQVTDPHNVGAILRSAAAFGALAVVLTDRNAPPETGTLAKSASGALEHVPLVRVTNLAGALDKFKEAGFWCAGLAAEGRETLAEAGLGGRVALVLGSEGEGLRRLTRERCDLLVRLPTAGPIGHLNVSNAAAIGLYELARDGPGASSGDRSTRDA